MINTTSESLKARKIFYFHNFTFYDEIETTCSIELHEKALSDPISLISFSQDGFADFTSHNSSQAPANSSSSDLFDVFSSNTNNMQSSVPIQPMNQGLMGNQPMNMTAPGLNITTGAAPANMASTNVMGQPLMSQQQPGMMSPPVMSSQSGMMTSQPGMMTAQPGMIGMQQPVSFMVLVSFPCYGKCSKF